MTEVLREILPIALAVAASPFPILPAILLLFSPRPRAAGLAFLAGWLTGVLVATSVFVLVSELVAHLDDEPAAWVSWVRLTLGLGLLGYGVRQWLTRHASSEPPAWMSSLDSAAPRSAGRLGLLLAAANPKIVLLCAAGGLAIGAAELGTRGDVVAVLAFTMVGSITVAVPVLAYVIFGDRVLPPLRRAKDWLDVHSGTVMAVVIFAIGALLVVNGIRGITAR